MSDYWESSETQPDMDTWLGFWDGCIMCACDHGCNQWLKEQEPRAALLMEAMRRKCREKTLNKLVQMPLENVNKMWFNVMHKRSRLFNKLLREKSGKIDETMKAYKRHQKR